MKKTKRGAILLTAIMLIPIFTASLTASADAIISLGIHVRKEGTEDPINPSKVNVWYTRLNVPHPEEKEAFYFPQAGCWIALASIKDEVKDRASFSVRVEYKPTNTEKEQEIYDLKYDPDAKYRLYFYFIVNKNSRTKNLFLMNFLEFLCEKLNWQFPILQRLIYY